MMECDRVPILANDEQISLYNQFMFRIDANNKKRKRRYLRVAICLFIPFCVFGIGHTTYGFDVNQNLFSVEFALSLAIPLAILPWVRLQAAVSICMLIPLFLVIFYADVIDGACDENFYFCSGFLISATLPVVMVVRDEESYVATMKNAERAWEAE